MKIIDFLKQENCIVSLTGKTRDDILIELTEHISNTGEISNKDNVLTALLEREKLGSTGIGNNIAIPHAKIADVQDLVAAFGISREGIEFAAVDNQPVNLVFLILANSDSSSKHLKALARISRLLKNDMFHNQVINAKSSSEVYNLIEEEDRKLA
ncbi:MAG TPA: PTS sugar transporter subunit IIA [Nitrospinota bacterium]|nr:PTS sugar transporter subunit IIA [Nitrospinota bacterium]|tara:strand:+ start:9024 stop:9488 length:465 start_codon:yes stop_codon:yes gene_type:complete